jgi:hypothetical protein
MREGITTSQRWTEERERGQGTSSFVTAMVPTGELDCCYTIVVGREDMMRSLRQLGLDRLKF